MVAHVVRIDVPFNSRLPNCTAWLQLSNRSAAIPPTRRTVMVLMLWVPVSIRYVVGTPVERSLESPERRAPTGILPPTPVWSDISLRPQQTLEWAQSLLVRSGDH